MSNDSKLGMVIGVGVVIVIAALFFRRDTASARSTPETSSVAAKPGAVPAPPLAHQPVPAPARTVGYKHVVADGETLASLAQRYYNDGNRQQDIFQANRDVLSTPDQLRPGTVLFIPNHE